MGEIKRKATFGGCKIEGFSPDPSKGPAEIINIFLSFEDALKLHLSIGQLLGRLNSYNRSTKEGKASRALIAVHTSKSRITVHENSPTRKKNA